MTCDCEKLKTYGDFENTDCKFRFSIESHVLSGKHGKIGINILDCVKCGKQKIYYGDVPVYLISIEE